MKREFDLRCGHGQDVESFRSRVLAKPLPGPRSLAQGTSFFVPGQGFSKQTFLFPLSPGLALPIASIHKRAATSKFTVASTAAARATKRRSSAYASWAKDPEKFRSRTGKIASGTSLAAEESGSSQDAGEEDQALCLLSTALPATELSEERSLRLSRERLEMLEAARRREAEEQQRRAEKDSWQIAALAERRREAVERRKREAEQRRRETEAQRRREELEECRRRERTAAVIAKKHSEEGCPACASDLHGDMLLLVFRFLDAYGLLLSAMGVRELWHSVAKTDALWLPLCRQRWTTKAPRFHLTAEKQAALLADPFGPPSWFDAYKEAEEDGVREFIFRDELTQLKFQFHWRRFIASGQAVSSKFRFEEDGFTSGHPFSNRYPWVLDELGVGIQWGPTDDMFPKGFVSRLADWSWRIENVNAVLIEADVGCEQAMY